MPVVTFNLTKNRPLYTYTGAMIASLYNPWYTYKANLPDGYVTYNINMPDNVLAPNYKLYMRSEDGRCPL